MHNHDSAEAGAPLPLLAAKLTLPRPRAQLIARPRLLARLDAALEGSLTLIAAPAGFGKTTLLAEWLSQPAATSRHVAWLALDAADSDPIQFVRYLIAALQTLDPSIGAAVLTLLHSAQEPPLDRLMVVLANDLVALPEASILALDDYHVVDAPAVHQALAFLLDHLPPQLHLVLASRVDPPLPLSRWRARGRLSELRAQDLRFTAEEAAAFLGEVMDLSLTPADVAALEARTEGWIAGLQLAALSLRDLPPEQTAQFIDAFTGSHHFVVDYLMDEVLARQPAHVQTFLLQTSILHQLSGPLCDAVVLGTDPSRLSTDPNRMPAGDSYSQLLLESLERANLFLVAVDTDRRWYRYHQLFADALRHRLQTGATSGAIATLHDRAATWYEQHGLIAQAIHHALSAHDAERAARLLLDSVEPMLKRGEFRALHHWLRALPPDVVRGAPRLTLAYAWTQFLVAPFQADAVEALLHDAEAATRHGAGDTASADAELRGRSAAIRSSVASNQEDIPRTIALAQEALAYLPETDVFWRIIPAVNLGLAYDAAGDVAAAGRAFDDAITLCQAAGNTYVSMIATMHLARVRATQGGLHQAAGLFGQTLAEAARQGWMRLPMVGLPYIWLGKLLYEWNDLENASRSLLDGIKLVAPGEHQRLLLEGYATLARVKQAQGDEPGALALMRQATEVGQGTRAPWAAPLLAAYEALLALARRDIAHAAHWTAVARRSPDDQATAQSELADVLWTRVLIARGQPAEALPVLERRLREAEAAGRLASVIEVLALQAMALQSNRKDDQALVVLGRALTLAEPEGYIRTFVDEGAPMAALLREGPGAGGWGLGNGSRAHNVRAYAEKLIRLFPTTDGDQLPSVVSHPRSPDPQPPTPSPLAERLTERELEVLRLLAVGRSNQAIAQELIVAVGTVKRHVNSIMGKLQVESRLEAVVRARELGLV